MIRLSLIAVCLLGLALLARSNRAEPGEAPLEALEWLAGDWRDDSGPGLVQEVWTQPHGSNMTGVFRMIAADGSVRVIELIAISFEDDRYVMRLRHFDQRLTPWAAESEGPVVLYAESAGERMIQFTNDGEDAAVRSIKIEREGDTVRSTIFSADSAKPFGFVLRRQQ